MTDAELPSAAQDGSPVHAAMPAPAGLPADGAGVTDSLRPAELPHGSGAVDRPVLGAARSDARSLAGLILALLALLGVVLLAVLVGNGVLRPRPSPLLARQVGAEGQQVALLTRQMEELQARVATLAARPQPATVDLGPLAARVAALEARPVPSAASAQDFAGLSARVDALAARQDALSAKQQSDAAAASDRVAAATGGLRADLTALSTRLDATADKAAIAALAGRLDASDGADRTALAALSARLDKAAAQSDVAPLPGQIAALDHRVAALEAGSGQVAGLADRAQRLARLQSAEVALRSGQPLGVIPGAPAAVARFATAAPPTEAALRLAYPDAAEQARVTSQPQTARQPIWTRMWARVQQSVVVRQGDHVLVGDPAAGVLARARDAVDAGDIAGAVAILGTLQGPAAQAMAGWVGQAQALLAAQSALAALVARA